MHCNSFALVRLVFAWVFLAGMAAANCAPERIDLRGDWGQARFSIEIARTPAEQSQGLMNRLSMPTSASMLFVYPSERAVSFWMRNTLIPLDMIFADATGTVQKVHANAVPLDETAIFGGDNIQYVLEINGGLAAVFGIAPGTQIRHPEIDAPGAAWPCD